MANKPQLRTVGGDEFTRNDPFAELTRIMGFDPRVQPAPAADNDFEIDLEKELMGAFDLDPVEAFEAEAAAARPAADAGHAAADAEAELLASSLDRELSEAAGLWAPEGDTGEEFTEARADDVPAPDLTLAAVDMDFGPTAGEERAPPVRHERPAPSQVAESAAVLFAARLRDAANAQRSGAMAGLAAVEKPILAPIPMPMAVADHPETEAQQPEASTGAKAEEDPFAVLASLGLDRPVAPARPVAAPPAHEEPPHISVSFTSQPRPVAPAFAPEAAPEAAAAPDDALDIDTVEVPEPAVAIADDLDIPVPEFRSEPPLRPDFDDLDHEFEQAFQVLAHGSHAVREVHAEAAGTVVTAEFAHPRHEAAAPAATAYAHEAAEAAPLAFDEHDFLPEGFAGEGYAGASYEDGEADESAFVPPAAGERRRPAMGRGMMAAAAVVGVALLGGVAALALSAGGDEAGSPVVLRADGDPVKVKPAQPGGMSVPNQDNKVYERVAEGAQAVQPEQKTLVSNAEEPVDVAARVGGQVSNLPGVLNDGIAGDGATDEDAAADEAPRQAIAIAPATADAERVAAAPASPAAPAKAEDRVLPAADETATAGDGKDVNAVAPRRVRTMVVRPDGTLVPREEVVVEAPTPAPAVRQGQRVAAVEAKPAAPASAAKADPIAAMAAARPVEEEVQPATPRTAQRRAQDQEVHTPDRVAVAPQRPADQPLDIVGAVSAPKAAASADKPVAVAAREQAPAAGTAASAGWSVQIASQPTAEGAQASYQDLARRYGGVLAGHDVNIVKAEIAGKGTYYRVRMAASSKEEAVQLCLKLKEAGGNCFVSR